MKRNVLLFVFVLIVSCKASYPWYDFMVFRDGDNVLFSWGVEHIILRSDDNYITCTDYGINGDYFRIGKWERHQDTLILYPGYKIESRQPEKVEKVVRPDTISVLKFWDEQNIARVFLIRKTFIQEITDYSCEMLGVDGKMIWRVDDYREIRLKQVIKLTNRKGKFDLLDE